MKLGSMNNGIESEHRYSNQYEIIKYQDGTECLKVTTSDSGADLLTRLGRNISPNWFFLYVLLIPHSENTAGRYQSSVIQSYDGVVAFIQKFKSFLDGDGKHHLWLGSTTREDLIIYDNHNILYCYGPIQRFIHELAGFKVGFVRYPAPHTHHYNTNSTKFEQLVLDEFPWKFFPLGEHDNC